ncbi:sugar ABC transporter permease [Texcoconibacillus texcoconensis]|uniref:Maltose/maltodextrin transport system permease protein n=1 Tax=Texcoconibacillus texcoconensis TaxID=1095777 RepID=A0A840QSS4_9BACI|nr:sugar ABC transporter permease [Texcoconibacillus texcoconensis]MBB5174341.1 arabinogalactan oligomer/maltooligosaccharide transport system permease protein [Texcoconibacillus texcoconensis]
MATNEKQPKEVKQQLVNPDHKPRVAALLSIIPGIGQMYNKRFGKGTALFILFAAFAVVLVSSLGPAIGGLITLGEVPGQDDSRVFLSEGLLSATVVAFFIGFYVLNILDAHKDAKRIQLGWEVPNLREGFRNAWDTTFPYVLISPGMFLLIFVVAFPLMFMLALAFTNYNLYNAPPRAILDWVGFQNFTNLFTIAEWRNTLISVFSWTLIWTFVATTLQIILALFLAILVNDPRLKFKKLIRTVFILPWAVPAFVTILIFSALFNDNFGAINRDILIPLFGMSDGIPWLSDPFWTRTALIMIQTWLGFPFVFALFTGVLQSISSDWYEAADIDGANRWQKFKFITFPHVMFATAPLLIMQYSFNFNNFNIIYLFNEGGPAVRGQTAGGTDILISWVYGLTFDNQQFNMAAAISIILGLLVATFAFFQFRRTRSFKEEGSI